MQIRKRIKPPSRKFIYIFFGTLVALGIVYFIWQNYKYLIVRHKIAATVAKETNRLYTVTYDSLSFDEAAGNAYLKNIHIYPDTFMIKKMSVENMPYVLLDIKIKSINVTGVKTAEALAGQNIVGDSVVINQPEIILYSLKPLVRKTKIEQEAEVVYEEILGNLKLIQLKYVFVNGVRVRGSDFFTKEKNFELVNAKVKLNDVLIDSAHNNDSNRVLFSRQADFTIDSFLTYNNNRQELNVNDIKFSGQHHSLLFNEVLLNRFENATSKPGKLLNAQGLSLVGLNTDEIVKNKNIMVDSILCKQITIYPPPAKKISETKTGNPEADDSTGFMHVYSIYMRHLSFPKVNFIPPPQSNYSIGNTAIKVNEVKADEVIKMQTHPLRYSKEAEIAMSSLSIKSKDNHYDFNFRNLVLNSLQKQLKIGSFTINPYAGEKQFAGNEQHQKDRYDVNLSDIKLSNISMEDLLGKKIVASELLINNTSAKIYRDLTRPLERKSKVGNYPSQLLKKLGIPVNIKKVNLPNAYIEYKEKEVVSDSTGIINFADSKLSISNVTNMLPEITKNNALDISFDTKVLRTIPLKGNFKFILNSDDGNFIVNGHTPSFDALLLNEISIPMALIKVDTGKINSIDFHLSGNNTGAKGNLVMKYEGLKVDVLKRDKNTKDIKKRGLMSFAANIIIKNNNPNNGKLRGATPSYERNIYRSFFNLVWKTIFAGMKETIGVP